jgi:hypothetical protein
MSVKWRHAPPVLAPHQSFLRALNTERSWEHDS